MRSITRRSIAASALLSLALTSGAVPLSAGSGAVLAGRVTASDGASPRGDVVVHLLQEGRETSVASAATDARGAFRMDAAPAGTYRVLVEAPDLQITPADMKPGAAIAVQVEVENTGERLGDEVVQLYVQDVEASLPGPQLQLQGFTRIRLAPGEKQTIRFTLTAEQLSVVDEAGTWHLEPGDFRVWIGGQQPNLQSDRQPANVKEGRFTVQDR